MRLIVLQRAGQKGLSFIPRSHCELQIMIALVSVMCSTTMIIGYAGYLELRGLMGFLTNTYPGYYFPVIWMAVSCLHFFSCRHWSEKRVWVQWLCCVFQSIVWSSSFLFSVSQNSLSFNVLFFGIASCSMWSSISLLSYISFRNEAIKNKEKKTDV